LLATPLLFLVVYPQPFIGIIRPPFGLFFKKKKLFC